MEKQKFEDSLKDIFQEAKLSPSENVWTNIELDLERLESGKMKRRLLFFKWLAAASVTFAMAAAGVSYYVNDNDIDRDNSRASSGDIQSSGKVIDSEGAQEINSISENNTDTEKSQLKSSKDISTDNHRADNTTLSSKTNTPPIGTIADNNSLPHQEERTALQQQEKISKSGLPAVSSSKARGENETSIVRSSHDASLTERNTMGEPLKPDDQSFVTVASEDKTAKSLQDEKRGQEIMLKDRQLPPLVYEQHIKPEIPKTGPDELDLLMARLAGDKQLEEKSRKEKDSDNENLWTSVGFSAGAFNNASTRYAAINQSVSSFNAASASNTINNEKNASGLAYSIGIALGGRISEKWIIQGGLNYMTQTSNYKSNAVVTSDYQNFAVATSYDINKLSSDARAGESLLNTASYSVNNSLQFISIPVQAGFILLDKSFGIQLNGGVSTDLFIQNTITPEGNLKKVTNGRESDSPYKPLNFSALFGTEVSYRFADRYRLALVPSIRYPFSSIYKSELKLDATPVTFDVGLRFRYIFH